MDKYNYISYTKNRGYGRLEAIEAKQRSLNDAVRRHTADVQEALFGGGCIVIRPICTSVGDDVKATDKLRISYVKLCGHVNRTGTFVDIYKNMSTKLTPT